MELSKGRNNFGRELEGSVYTCVCMGGGGRDRAIPLGVSDSVSQSVRPLTQTNTDAHGFSGGTHAFLVLLTHRGKGGGSHFCG